MHPGRRPPGKVAPADCNSNGVALNEQVAICGRQRVGGRARLGNKLAHASWNGSAAFGMNALFPGARNPYGVLVEDGIQSWCAMFPLYCKQCRMCTRARGALGASCTSFHSTIAQRTCFFHKLIANGFQPCGPAFWGASQVQHPCSMNQMRLC